MTSMLFLQGEEEIVRYIPMLFLQSLPSILFYYALSLSDRWLYPRRIPECFIDIHVIALFRYVGSCCGQAEHW
jgi:hypothetical protein